MSNVSLARSKAALHRRQPNSNDCFVCGRDNPHGLHMTFYDNGEDLVFADYAVPEAYQGYPGIVHGGIVAAMLDEVVGRVAMIGDHHHFMMSVRMEVKYRHPVPIETPLRITGRIVRLRGRLGKAVGEVTLPDGTRRRRSRSHPGRRPAGDAGQRRSRGPGLARRRRRERCGNKFPRSSRCRPDIIGHLPVVYALSFW